MKNNPISELCTGCGMCATELTSSLRMNWDQKGFLVPEKILDEDVSQAIKVCPFNSAPEASVADEDKLSRIYLKDATLSDDRVGLYESIYVGYSNKYRLTSSSGGIATYVFEYLLKNNIVSSIFIVGEMEGGYGYKIISDVDQVKYISKTRYFPVTMVDVFNEIDKVSGNVAISGVACFLKAVRLKQYYNPHLKDKIPFLVGIICGGWKSKFFTDFLAQKSGLIGSYSHQEYRVKDKDSSAIDYSFSAVDLLGKKHSMKMLSVGDMWGTGLFKSPACDFCSDVLTELADISLGDAWLPDYREDGSGNSIIIARSKLANDILINGVYKEELTIRELDIESAVNSQYASFLHRRDALKFRIAIYNFFGKTVPHVRSRVLKNISFPYMVVQICRMVTRKKSIDIWVEQNNARVFDKKMKLYLFMLKVATRIYHKFR
tara:strand:+ start:5270 stop:6568 length:1299 start_codon:yes stop_codon:yes gene_type:complete